MALPPFVGGGGRGAQQHAEAAVGLLLAPTEYGPAVNAQNIRRVTFKSRIEGWEM